MVITISCAAARPPPRVVMAYLLPLLPLLLLLLLPTQRAGAVDWVISPTVRLRETYSDNLYLAPEGQARGGRSTEIAPGITLSGSSRLLRVDFAYTLQKMLYSDRADSTNHQLLASADAVVAEDWFYLDARSSISQQNISAFGPQAFDNSQRGGNRSSVRSNSLSPYLLHRFRGLAATELRYSWNQVSSDAGLLSVASRKLLLRLTGDNSNRSWNWSATHQRDEIDDAALAPVSKVKTELRVNTALSTRLSLFATAGTEKEGYEEEGGAAPQGKFWTLGAGVYPSSRSSLVFSAGKRFFGNTYTLDAAYRGRRSNFALSYNEDITTTQGQFLQLSDSGTAEFLNQLWQTSIPDPIQRQQRVLAFLRYAGQMGEQGVVNYFSHRYYLQKQLKLSLGTITRRSTLVVNLAATKRDAQTSSGIDNVLLGPIDMVDQDQTEQRSANAGWTWALTSRTDLALNAGYSTIEAVTSGRKDNNLVASAMLSHVIKRGVSAAIDLRRVRHGTNRGGDYRENALSASLTFQL